jgi:hypothetical protein
MPAGGMPAWAMAAAAARRCPRGASGTRCIARCCGRTTRRCALRRGHGFERAGAHPRPHLLRDWARPAHGRAGSGLTPGPHLHRDWARPSRSACTRTCAHSCLHICAGTGTGLAPAATSVGAAPKLGLTPDHVRAGTKCAHLYCLTWALTGFQVLFGGVGALERPLHDLWTFDMRACAWAREPPPSGELPPVRTQRAP